MDEQPLPAGDVLAVPTFDAVATDFSMLGLFMQADWVVKAVMLGLIFASVWSWAIIFEKWLTLRSVNRRADQFERVFWSGQSLENLYEELGHRPQHPLSAQFVAAMREWRRSKEAVKGVFQGGALIGVKERIDRVMSVTLSREMEKLESRLLVLATVGSVSPFIGLFGTVWGIMNSFQAIAVSRDTNLAVVAPGIAEALFATALGLVAAIPALIAYNWYSNRVNRFGARMEGFADEFSAILSRQLDERG